MKRKASIGFILLFLLYLGCKSSLFGVCLSADSFVTKATVPPCHQTENTKAEQKDSCDCPIVLETLQTSEVSVSDGKPFVSYVVWQDTQSLFSWVSFHHQISVWSKLSQAKIPPHSPTRTIRLLI